MTDIERATLRGKSAVHGSRGLTAIGDIVLSGLSGKMVADLCCAGVRQEASGEGWKS